MEDIIKLHSRGGVNNYLKKMKRPNGEESKNLCNQDRYAYSQNGVCRREKKVY